MGKQKYDYLIVGAGLFGAVFAQKMNEYGKKCLVIDRRTNVGGNVYTEEMEGINVHMYGPHIFHTSDTEVWEYIQRFAHFNNFRYEPIANYKGQLYNLPFNMNTFHQMWGVNTPLEVTELLNKQRSEIKGEPTNLEEQAIKLIGRDIYEKLIKGYTQKQWGRPCTELPPFIIKRLPVRLRFDNNYFNDPYQGIPQGGYTHMVKNMLQGIEVELDSNYLSKREYYNSIAQKVVYTGPIDAYFDYKLGNLEYRSLRFETEVLDLDNYQGVAGMNYTDADTPYTRIVEHKHFEFGKGNVGKTVITREYSKEWKPGDEPYYPINDNKNQRLYEQYKNLAKHEESVIFGGRLAEYKYYDMDKVIRNALNLVKRGG
jgi:UDP-galactopyranose mutase